jgi:dihydro-heme d1 dehydrogenase
MLTTLILLTGLASTPELSPVQILYQDHCASCHSDDRLGAMGPALLPENLGRMLPSKAEEIIVDGKVASQMPAYKSILTAEEISSLTDYIFSPTEEVPTWDKARIDGSHVVSFKTSALSDKPTFDADVLNLFVVVESGDHHVTILDGDTFEPLTRFQSRFALHGGAKFSPDGRFTYLASRDGWVTKFDLYTLQIVAETRAAINTRNIAVSSDGRTVIVGNTLPHNLVLLDGDDLSLIKVLDVTSTSGQSSRISAVYNAPPRQSFVAALRDFQEVWELPYGDGADLTPRRLKVDTILDDFMFDQSYEVIIGAARDLEKGQIIDMDTGQKTAEIELAGMPHLGSGITWQYEGRTVFATPHLTEAKISVIEMESWETIKEIKTKGPGFFMRSHETTNYAWAGVFFGPNKDLIHIIDKRTLEIVRTLKPAPGQTAAHVEFTRDGSHALVSVLEEDGALIVFDAKTLEEVKRLPMKRPVGKYNVYNKIHYSEGTSH